MTKDLEDFGNRTEHRQIVRLSPITINRIAAGEVVERPASAIKELVENALDAGASEITIRIEAGGKGLISVSDNGCGMTPEDLAVAVESHTTSKLKGDDLLSINQLGFRGEAIASIGAVSRLTIKSRPRYLEEGSAISVLCGNKTEVYPTPHHVGTTVEVLDLFCATPARLKFLRSERTEQQYIENIIKKIAVAYPKVAFKFFRDGKLVLDYKSTDVVDPRAARVAEVLGKEFLDSCIIVDAFDSDLRLYGYISLPTYMKSYYNEQHLYVNDRPIRDRLLLAYIKVAYQDMLSHDRNPLTILFLESPPALVDVNVHPTKAEVRFRDISTVKNLVIGTLKDSLVKHGHIVDPSVSRAAFDLMCERKEQTIGSYYEPLSKKIDVNEEGNNFMPSYYGKHNQDSKQSFIQQPFHLSDSASSGTFIQDKFTYNSLTASIPRLGYARVQLHNRYIVSQTEAGVVVVDQHAAHERICYEKLKQQVQANNIHTQTLFISEIIEVDDQELVRRVLNLKDKLPGFVIEQYSEHALRISAIPQVLKGCDIRALFNALIHNIIELEDETNVELFTNKILGTYSCYGSIRSGRTMSIDEMNALLREMERVQCTASCNHGRPTYIELSVKDLDNLFERR